jgi:transposase-like protein
VLSRLAARAPAPCRAGVRLGNRESLGLDVVTTEDGAAWLAFLRSLVARGFSGVKLVSSDAHPGLVDAIQATLRERAGNDAAHTSCAIC